jgi:hypothetical protein
MTPHPQTRARLAAVLAVACVAMAAPEAPAGTPERATITQRGTSWTLQNDALKAVVSFDKGSVDLTSLCNQKTGEETLTGSGDRGLFRHVIDGDTLRAKDGGWSLVKDAVSDIVVHKRPWGKELSVDLSRPASKVTITLVFEIYDGMAGLRYYSFLKNDDTAKKRVVSESDVIALNFPDKPHTIFHVPWQTKWARIQGALAWGKRQCLTRYDDTGAGWALLPENNWTTSMAPGGYKGDPKHPFLSIQVWGGIPNVVVKTDPQAVQLALFPGERIEYFGVNLQLFTGDEWDARTAVAEHFRKRFKYHNPLPQLDFQEYQVEFLQNDAMARTHLAPALAEAGFDKWEVTWRWNGCNADDRTEPRPGFTKDLPALAEFFLSKGLKIGYYFAMNGQMNGNGWGGGRDLADPREIATKQKQVEEILIGRYHSTWQMIDLGEFWKNDKETAYSHPSDNVYRKALNLRNYMTAMTRKYPGFVPLTTCETENPGGAQGVSLMLIGENGQAGTYCRTDGGVGSSKAQRNLCDAFNYIGLFPLEAFVGVYGEAKPDPWPHLFKPDFYYTSLLSGCSTVYSDVRKWTPEQKRHMRLFNDWRKNPRIGAMLRELARPLYNGPDNNNAGPYAWMYADAAKSQALVVAVAFNSKEGNPSSFDVRLRALDPDKTYGVEEITLDPAGFAYAYGGAFTGQELMSKGIRVDPSAREGRCVAAWLKALVPGRAQVLYADAVAAEVEESVAGGALAATLRGTPNAAVRLVVVKPDRQGVENRDVKLDAGGRATATFDGGTINENAGAAKSVLRITK